MATPNDTFNIAIVAQQGRLQFEALLFAGSLRAQSPDFKGQLFVCEPQEGPLWPNDPKIKNPDVRAMLKDLGAQIVPFSSQQFGAAYPQGNKIELLSVLPKGEPFVFFDTDTLITGDIGTVPFDFARPSASLRVSGTWPTPPLYGPVYAEIWRSLYDMFDLDFETSLDLSFAPDDWRRYLYFNAGFFYFECPHRFGELFIDFACKVRDRTPEELAAQELYPWLDQIALPLVIHALGGGRDALPMGYLDGSVSCHYRMYPLLYAREHDQVVAVLEEVAAPNKLKNLLKLHEPIKRMVYQGRGAKVRALFNRDKLPASEKLIRNKIRSNGFWMR